MSTVTMTLFHCRVIQAVVCTGSVSRLLRERMNGWMDLVSPPRHHTRPNNNNITVIISIFHLCVFLLIIVDTWIYLRKHFVCVCVCQSIWCCSTKPFFSFSVLLWGFQSCPWCVARVVLCWAGSPDVTTTLSYMCNNQTTPSAVEGCEIGCEATQRSLGD